MSDWLSNNIGTLLAGLIVLVIVGLIIFNMIRKKKRGEKIIDCGGNCGSCGGSCNVKPGSGESGASSGNTVYNKGELGLFKTVLSIDGMACNMCESHINDCIRNGFEVKNVYSSHKKGETVIISKEPLNEEAVRKAVENTGYRVLDFSTEKM